MRRPFPGIPARALTLCILLSAVFSGAAAQESTQQTTAEGTGSTFPIDLVTALRLAGARNLDVQLARTAVQDAHANYYSAVERFLPTFVPAASYLHHTGRDQRVEGPLIDVTKHNETAGVTALAEIPVGEALFQTLQTRQLLAAADAAQTAQEQDTQLTVAQQYLELVNAGALVEVVSQALAISQNYEQQLNEAVRIGTAFKGDAFRVQTQTRRLQLDLTRAKEQRRLAATRLAQTLHLDPLVDLVPAEREPAPLALADLNATPDALVRTALQNRPELTQTGSLIAAAQQARRGALYGPLIPTIGGRAFAGELGGGVGDTDVNGGPRREYGVGLSWKIGPGGLFDLGRIKASNANLTVAEVKDEKMRDAIARQVVDGYTQVQSLFQQVRDARLNVSSAEETLRLTRGRKELGVGTVLEDIQAQQDLEKARSDLNTVVTQLNQQQYALLYSVGTALHKP
ncbi:MAG: TolC family protein [Gammaproteobacteria bacterium]|jgi:outer membrane protein TolC|nr:TolC family protein [Gammaproteobacteria bacterium]